MSSWLTGTRMDAVQWRYEHDQAVSLNGRQRGPGVDRSDHHKHYSMSVILLGTIGYAIEVVATLRPLQALEDPMQWRRVGLFENSPFSCCLGKWPRTVRPKVTALTPMGNCLRSNGAALVTLLRTKNRFFVTARFEPPTVGSSPRFRPRMLRILWIE